MTFQSCASRPVAVALLLSLVLGTGCGDPTGPDHSKPSGRQVLTSTEYTSWTWLPGGTEILYATPSSPVQPGTPTRLEAVDVATGARRVVVPALQAGSLIGYRFMVAGAHVYFEVSPKPDHVALYRAPINGALAADVVLDSTSYGVVVSPEETMAAWMGQGVGSRTLTVADLHTGTRSEFTFGEAPRRVIWAPAGPSLVLDPDGWFAAGTPFAWFDLGRMAIQSLTLAGSGYTEESVASTHIRWEDGNPILYTKSERSLLRYSIATGDREVLAQLPTDVGGDVIDWRPDREQAVLVRNECTDWSSGPFGGDCTEWDSSADLLAWRSGSVTSIMRLVGSSPILAGKSMNNGNGTVSPGGGWLAYSYSQCGGGCQDDGDGLYVVAIP